MKKHILIIGGGPGGYVAALRSAKKGAQVTLIEKDTLGGTCLNRGCIPTKTLYKNAEIINTLNDIDTFGISIPSYEINVSKIQERKNNTINQLVTGIDALMKSHNIEVIQGDSTFKNKSTIIVTLSDGTTKEFTSDNIIIATGSLPAVPPIPGVKLDGVLNSEEILNFETIPSTLTIIGGGVIGLEFAAIFSSMGTKVTVVEFLPRILSMIDSELIKRLQPLLKRKGITLHTSTKVTKIEKSNDSLVVLAEGKKGTIEIPSENVLVSVGRKPNFDNLSLDNAEIDFSNKGISTDDNFETNVKGIYAIGDVNGRWMLAHAASHQGISVSDRIIDGITIPPHNVVPGCIFIFPEISYAGISEDEAKESKIEYKTSKFFFRANGKALALGESDGFVKIIASKVDDTILGVHIMGPHASSLIHEGVLAVSCKLTATDISNTIHAHPTLSETLAEAVMGLNDESIHSAPSKK